MTKVPAMLKLPDGSVATIHEGEWVTSDPRLQRAIQLISDTREKIDYEPDVDALSAHHVARVLGGKVTYVEDGPDLRPGEVQ